MLTQSYGIKKTVAATESSQEKKKVLKNIETQKKITDKPGTSWDDCRRNKNTARDTQKIPF